MNEKQQISDTEIIEYLKEIDESADFHLNNWEMDFIESICYKRAMPWLPPLLSEKQRSKALEIIKGFEEKMSMSGFSENKNVVIKVPEDMKKYMRKQD